MAKNKISSFFGLSGTKDDTVRRQANRVASTVWVIPATILVIALTIVCLKIFWRDVETSMWGYQQFPTNKGGNDIALFVALFFPLLQMVMGIMSIAFLADSDKGNDKWGYLFIFLTLIGFSFDAGTDIWFRVNGVTSPEVIFVAVYETLVIYTLATEVALSICIALLIVLVPNFLREISSLFGRARTGMPSVSSMRGTMPPPMSVHGPGAKKRNTPKNAKQARLVPDKGVGEIRQLERDLDKELEELLR